ncbi:MAG: hypothetical protein FH749_13860 [Firmicutes bacterium]|nr:hypothetical protein [Bacillota bacterium]
MKRRLKYLLPVLLTLALLAGCTSTSAEIENTIKPADLTIGESQIASAFADTSFIFDLALNVETEVNVELWVVHYSEGLEENRMGPVAILSEDDERVMVGVTDLPTGEQLWKTKLNGNGGTFAWPKPASTAWTWSGAPEQQSIEFGKPVLLACMVGTKSGGVSILRSIFDGDEAMMAETLKNDDVFLVYLQVTER